MTFIKMSVKYCFKPCNTSCVNHVTYFNNTVIQELRDVPTFGFIFIPIKQFK